MNHFKLCFIGYGNMARSVISGLIHKGYPPSLITAASPSRGGRLTENLGITIFNNNQAAAHEADVLILAVKPPVMKSVCEALASIMNHRHRTVISVAAGITLTSLERWLGARHAIVRCMPNLPCSIGYGATGLYANGHCTEQDKSIAEALLRAVGITVWLNQESDLDLVTAISGCGPAYFFKIMYALEQAITQAGLSADVAHLLITQTALGASQMVMNTTDSLSVLIDQVRSPGGTTEKALQVLDNFSIMTIFDEVVAAARHRAAEIAHNFENS